MRIQVPQPGQTNQPYATLTGVAGPNSPVNLIIQNVSAAANIFISTDPQALNISDPATSKPVNGLILGPNSAPLVFPSCWKATVYAVADGAGAYAEVQETPA